MALGLTQDSIIQIAPDSTGKKVDNATLTRDDGTVVYRQRTVIGADDNPRLQVSLGGENERGYLLVDARAFNELIEKMDEMMDLIKLSMDL